MCKHKHATPCGGTINADEKNTNRGSNPTHQSWGRREHAGERGVKERLSIGGDSGIERRSAAASIMANLQPILASKCSKTRQLHRKCVSRGARVDHFLRSESQKFCSRRLFCIGSNWTSCPVQQPTDLITIHEQCNSERKGFAHTCRLGISR